MDASEIDSVPNADPDVHHAGNCGDGTLRRGNRRHGVVRRLAAPPAERESSCVRCGPVRMSWVRPRKRVFEIDLEHRPNCGSEPKIIAAILEQPVIEKILTHGGLQARAPPPGRQPAARRCKPSLARGRATGPTRPASGLTLPKRDRLCDPPPRAAGVGCVLGFAGPMEATW